MLPPAASLVVSGLVALSSAVASAVVTRRASRTRAPARAVQGREKGSDARPCDARHSRLPPLWASFRPLLDVATADDLRAAVSRPAPLRVVVADRLRDELFARHPAHPARPVFLSGLDDETDRELARLDRAARREVSHVTRDENQPPCSTAARLCDAVSRAVFDLWATFRPARAVPAVSTTPDRSTPFRIMNRAVFDPRIWAACIAATAYHETMRTPAPSPFFPPQPFLALDPASVENHVAAHLARARSGLPLDFGSARVSGVNRL